MTFGMIALGLTFFVPFAFMFASGRSFVRNMNEGSARHVEERLAQLAELDASMEVVEEIATATEVREEKLAA